VFSVNLMCLRSNGESPCANGRLTIDNLTQTMDNLQERASCTWNYAIKHDPSRLPVQLIEACCVCPPTAGQSSGCESILYPVPVKRLRGDVWIDTWDMVTVGCTYVENDQSYTEMYTDH